MFHYLLNESDPEDQEGVGTGQETIARKCAARRIIVFVGNPWKRVAAREKGGREKGSRKAKRELRRRPGFRRNM